MKCVNEWSGSWMPIWQKENTHMENTQRTLANFINPSQQQGQSQDVEGNTTSFFNTFLTVFSIQISQKFPDTTDLGSIDYQSIRQTAEFSLACSKVALQTWNEVNAPSTGKRGVFGRRSA